MTGQESRENGGGGRIQIYYPALASAWCVQDEVSGNKWMCLSLSLDHFPAEMILQPQRGTHHEFNPLATFWPSPSPSQTFCGLPSSPSTVVTSRRLPAHLCSGMGGSGPLTHTSILQPIISCLPWLPSKPQHDRWISSQESSAMGQFSRNATVS